ncbi:hypothetical protein LWI28_023003 [Acer negundo]|uniref:Uncharacterized protein n=1 Tax=Acer negundo TaxID=4023 RepID=A0AAD5IRB8_ACENE|nr:hypothetical protein LWI28_023003 [Acer negundo]
MKNVLGMSEPKRRTKVDAQHIIGLGSLPNQGLISTQEDSNESFGLSPDQSLVLKREESNKEKEKGKKELSLFLTESTTRNRFGSFQVNLVCFKWHLATGFANLFTITELLIKF